MTCDKLIVKPLTIERIKEIGFMNYNRYLSVLTLDKKSLTNDNPDYDEVSLIDLIIRSRDNSIISAFGEAMSVFLSENLDDLLIHDSLGFVFGGKDLSRDPITCNIVDSSNFSDFIKIIKLQNCLVEADDKYINEVKSNPADEKARRILEKLKKGQEMVEKAKAAKNSSTSSDTDFADVISAVSTKSNNFNRSSIWKSTIYQLYDEYKRLEAISSYEINIAAMIQGAKIDDLKHWSAKVD